MHEQLFCSRHHPPPLRLPTFSAGVFDVFSALCVCVCWLCVCVCAGVRVCVLSVCRCCKVSEESSRGSGATTLSSEVSNACEFKSEEKGLHSKSFSVEHVSKETVHEIQYVYEQLGVDISGVDITEMFNPDSFRPQASAMGLVSGTTFDLRTGWNLSCPRDRNACWERLLKEDPSLVIGSPNVWTVFISDDAYS